MFGDYQPLPSPWRQRVVFDRTAYGRALIDEPHRSHTSRYQQLIEDVRNDITRFEPFFASAIRVIELDRKRSASLKMVSELSPREQDDAVARMEENTLIVQWVQQCLERRISSYRWALERLVIQAPDTIAADADRLIGELAAQTANPPVAGTARDRARPSSVTRLNSRQHSRRVVCRHRPPSTTCDAPVMNDALSEHIQTTASAISSGTPMRFIGTFAITASRRVFTTSSVIGVVT